MKSIVITLPLVVCVLAAAQTESYQEYAAQIAALQRDGAAIAQEQGRDALIQRYRNLIDAYPGYANNIRLETQIAMLYESDFTDKGQPPDFQAAYNTYQQIVNTYDADHPYMVTVRQLEAKSAAEVDPATAEQMYQSLITDYPDHDAVVVQSRYSLAKLAAERGDAAAAQQQYEKILGFAPSGGKVSEAEQASIDAYRNNAVANLLAEAIRGYDTPQERMKALKKYLEKHQELLQAHNDLVQRFANTIESGKGGRGEGDDGAVSAEALLASIKKNNAGAGGAAKRERARTREARERGALNSTGDGIIESGGAVAAVAANANRPGGSGGPLTAFASKTTVTWAFLATMILLAALAMVVAVRVRRNRRSS